MLFLMKAHLHDLTYINILLEIIKAERGHVAEYILKIYVPFLGVLINKFIRNHAVLIIVAIICNKYGN